MFKNRLSSRPQIISAPLGWALVGLALSFGPLGPDRLLAQPPAQAASGDARDVVFHTIKADKILFLGNSITLHGPAPAIGWLGNWGMAASTQDNDYVHRVLKAIAQAAGKQPQSMVTNIADFERQFETYDIDSGLEKELALEADLVIIAIGENVSPLTSDQAKHAFKASMAKLLKKIKEHGNPVIVVRSSFWQDPAKDTILRETCQEAGGIFVDASALGKDEANYARSERKFSHAGVAGHPGDKGMQALADAILQALSQPAR